MIDLYFAPTPNGWKATIMLEECGLPYQLIPIDIGAGEQYEKAFLAISPNARMPAMVDPEGKDGPINIFESGAILIYLAEKSGQFMPQDQSGFYAVTQWLFWQVANLGPIAGQVSHFFNYAPEGNDYSKSRYLNEYDRLLGVMNYQLRKTAYLAGDHYTIADMACFPWLLAYKRYDIDLGDFPNLKRWFDELKQRPLLRKGVNMGKEWQSKNGPSDEARSILFHQTSAIYKGK